MNHSCITFLYIHRNIGRQFEYVCNVNDTFIFLNAIDLWIALGHISTSVAKHLKKFCAFQVYV